MEVQPTEARASSESSALRLGKRLLAAGTIYALTNFGLKGMNFLLLPIVSRYLEPTDFGLVALAETIAGPIGMICGLGAATALRRMYYEYSDDISARHAYVGTAIRFVALSAILVVVMACFVGPFLLHLADRKFGVAFFPLIGIAICAAGLGQVEQTQLSLFQVQNRPFPFAFISIFTFALGVACVLSLVVGFHMGAFGVLTSRLVGVICGVLVALYLTRGFIFAPWHWSGLQQQLRLGLPLAGFEVVNLGLIFADRIILQHYRSLNEVGVYSLAYTFGALMLTLTVSLSQVWSPLFFESSLAGEIETLRRASSSLMAGLVAAASVAVVIARPAIHVLLDPRYFATAALIPIILAAYLVNSFYYLFELQAMQQKRTNIVVVVTVVACALNIGLNIWFVPAWGMFGAALATVAAYVVQAGIMYAFVRPQAKHLYSAKLILANLSVFAAALAIVEVPWPTNVAMYLMPGSLLAVFILLWPLGLNRVAKILRSTLA